MACHLIFLWEICGKLIAVWHFPFVHVVFGHVSKHGHSRRPVSGHGWSYLNMKSTME